MAMSSIHHSPPPSSRSLLPSSSLLFASFFTTLLLSPAAATAAPSAVSTWRQAASPVLSTAILARGLTFVVSACFDAGGTLLSRPLLERCTLRHVGKSKHKWAHSRRVFSALTSSTDSLKVLLFFVLFVFWCFSFFKQRGETVSVLQKTSKKKMKG